jgi:hypothetical protein
MNHQYNIHNSDGNGKLKLTDELLMSYLEGKLNAQENRIVEELLSEDSAEADAIEGLQLIPPAETKRTVIELQRKLHTEILRKTAKPKHKFSEDFWSWIAIIIILLLITIGYVVIRIASK